jgi:hypothetical protein
MTRVLSGAKAQFQKASNASIEKISPDLQTYKENIHDLVHDDWFNLRSPAFNRILKNRGIVPKGLSKARGLEGGADWNKDLANLLTPAFYKWAKEHKEHMRHMLATLGYSFNAFHQKIIRVMTKAAANVPTVEKAKQKWQHVRPHVLVKLETLMDDVERVQARALEWATMEYDRQRNLISDITDNIYIEVFNSAPALKPPNPKAKKQSKQYVMPKMKFQQARLKEMFLSPDSHFVGQAVNLFRSEFEKNIRHTIDQHFARIEAIYDKFDTGIRAQGPINYKLTPAGEDIRAEVKERIPELQATIDHLKTFLPARASQDADTEEDQAYNMGAREDDEDDFATTYNKMSSKRKETTPPVECRPHTTIKREPF